MAQFSGDSRIYDESYSWQWRVIRASFGTTTGVITRAILAKSTALGIAFGQYCDIVMHGDYLSKSSDAHVVTPVRHKGIWSADPRARVPAIELVSPFPTRKEQSLVAIGTLEAVRDNLRRLADHCKLNDNDRGALFEELRKWVRRDHRAVSEQR